MKILHLEDSEIDAQLIEHILSHGGLPCEIDRVETREEFLHSLQNAKIDIVLSDCALPKFSGQDALKITRALKPEIPFVFVSGTIGEEVAIESLRDGATDYVLKDRLSRLVPAVRRALLEAEEKKLCHQMSQTLRQTRRLETVGLLAGGLAHDFNNILNIILGYASLLKEKENQSKHTIEIATTIDLAARRGAALVDKLMAFARKSEGHFVMADLNEQVRGVVAAEKRTLNKKISWVLDLQDNLPKTHLDPGQVSRILSNVLTNSHDAIPQEGQITITTSLVPAGQVPYEIPAAKSESYLCLQVTDTGTGMDEETLQHVFEPFYTTKPLGIGTGLGLPAVYGLMKSHQGFASIQSEPGKGTTVSLFFPVCGNLPTSMPKAPPATPLSVSGSEYILVVEDEPDLGRFLSIILRTCGYHPLYAATPSAAIALFKENMEAIKLVISDVGLPEMDGFNLCAKLQALKKDIRIILVSGNSDGSYKKRLAELGISAFIPKPYQAKEMLSCIRTTLNSN